MIAFPADALVHQCLSVFALLLDRPLSLDRAKEIRASLPGNVAGASEPLRLHVDSSGDLMKLLGERVAVNARQANLSVQVLLPHDPRNSPALPPLTPPPPRLHSFPS